MRQTYLIMCHSMRQVLASLQRTKQLARPTRYCVIASGLIALSLACQISMHAQSQSTSPNNTATRALVQPQATPGNTLITFSEFPDGTTISNQYANLGVLFSPNTFITDDAANPTSPVLSGSPLFFGPITVTFVNPTDSTKPATATNVTFDAGYFDTVGSTTVTYFDINGATISSVVNSQLGIQTFSAPSGIHGFTIAATGNEPAGFAIDNVSFQIQGQSVQAQNVTPGLNLNPETADVGTDAAKTLHLTLGGTYQIALGVKQNDGSVQAFPAAFSLGSASLSGDPDANVLFAGNAVMQYTNQVNNSAVFQATHVGTQPLTITPNNNAAPPLTVTLSVEAPTALGTSHPEFDDALYTLGDSSGIPPQMIKGQIAQEANFNPMTWRYEPFNGKVGDFAMSTKPKDLRTSAPYNGLSLPTIGDSSDPGCGNKYDYSTHVDSRIPDPNCVGLPQGGNFSSQVMTDIAGTTIPFVIAERDPSTGALITANGQVVTRPFQATDIYVSARDIVLYGNSRWNYTIKQNKGNVNALTSGATDFSAQLSLAASYGLLQVTYVTALSERWAGNTGSCGPTSPIDPDNLFDTSCNLMNGGGSLGIGTRITEANFATNQAAGDPNPAVSDEPTLETYFAQAYQLYNSGFNGYGTGVIAHSKSFEPTPSGTIFAQGAQ